VRRSTRRQYDDATASVSPVSSWRVEFTSAADRSLDRLPSRVLPAVLEFAYGPLSENPRRVGKPLRNKFEGLLSARRGDYRLVHEIRDADMAVIVHRVAHRSVAYRPAR